MKLLERWQKYIPKGFHFDLGKSGQVAVKADIQISQEYSKLFTAHKSGGEKGALGKVCEKLFIQAIYKKFFSTLL